MVVWMFVSDEWGGMWEKVVVAYFSTTGIRPRAWGTPRRSSVI